MTDLQVRGAKPRVLFVVNVSWFFVSHRLEHARGALQAGYEVHLATRVTSAADARAITQAGIVLHDTSLDRGGSLFAAVRSFRELCRVIRRERFDIVHLVTIKSIVVGGIAARFAGARSVVAAASGLGQVFTEHGMLARVRHWLVVRLLRLVVAHPRCLVICQNQDDRRQLVEVGAVRESQLRLIRGSGVDLRLFPPVEEGSPPLRVLLAARMLRSKGVEEFVAAAKLLARDPRDVEFVLAGDVDAENPTSLTLTELERLCASGQVKWLGHVTDMPALLASAHIVVLASRQREGLPKVLLEAAAAGRPIVGTDIPGIREIVFPELNGLLVRPCDSADLAAGIDKLLRDAELRRRFGAEGRRIVEKNLGLDTVISQTLGVYRELLAMS